MLHKYRTLILGTMLGLGTLAFSGAGASASAMLPLSSVASGEANAVSGGVIQVKHKYKWRRNHFGNRCYDSYGGCRHYRRYNHFNRSDLFLPFIIGGGFGAYNYYDYDDDYGYAGVSSRHVRWCLNRYRSYNPRSNLWVSFSGKKHQCDSPYS